MEALRDLLTERAKRLAALASLSTVRIFRRFLTEGVPAVEPSLEISSVAEFPEFPGLLSIVRVFTTIGIGIRFFLHREEYHVDGWRFNLQFGLFVLFALYAVAFELIPKLRRAVTTRPSWRRIQLGADIAVISVFYLFTYRIDSDFFLFYILPILFAAQYSSFRESLLVTLVSDFAVLLTVSVLTIFKLNQNPYFESWPEVLSRVVLARVFALTIVGVVSAFYRRIGVEKAEARTVKASIHQQISTLLRVSEYSDPKLVENLLRIVLAGITAQDGLAFERAMLFLKNSITGNLEGKYGVGPVNKAEGKQMWNGPVEWNFRDIVDMKHRRARFASRKLNQQLVKAVVPQEAVQPLADKVSDRVRYVKTTLDQCPQLSGVLKEFEVGAFVVVPLYSLKRLIGVLIADNVVTEKEIISSDLDDLVLFSNLAANTAENAALLRAHVEQEKMVALANSAVGLAHEMRNPLTAIKCQVELLLREDHAEETMGSLHMMLSDVRRLENIVNWYIEYGIGTRELEFSEVSILGLLREVVEEPMMAKQISSGAIDLRESLPQAGQEILVRIDPRLIERAIRNILQNAVDAVLQSGKRRIDVRIDQIDDRVEIGIRDYGSGISEKDFPQPERVFEPLKTTKQLTERSGVGLGLSIALAAVKAHGGDIRVSSSAEGAEFTIIIPK